MDPIDPARRRGESSPGGYDRPSPEMGTHPRRLMWSIALPLGFAFLLTLLFLAMRGVMDLGGMVALGGPYEIAHPAPGYWWTFPLSIIGMVLIIFWNMGMFSMFTIGQVKSSLVALLFWPAIFLSLGWNFLEYGIFRSGGLSWGWVVCGVAFVAMGGFPVYLALKNTTGRRLMEAARINRKGLLPQLAGIAAGIPLGVLLFRVVS